MSLIQRKMNINTLKEKLKKLVVFTQNDIRKHETTFSRENLSEWQKKGYIKKIVKGYYIFSNLEIDESVLFIIANKIYKPSYISFEMALSYYNLIPESVYGITSATTRHTYEFDTYLGQFSYRKIRRNFMFGYSLVKHKNHVFSIADIEKTIIDYFYIKPYLKSDEDFEGLRIDGNIYSENVKEQKLAKYLSICGSQSLSKRVKRFMRYMGKNA